MILFSKHMHVWFSVINFPIKKWKIMKNHKILPKFKITNLGIFFQFFAINPFFKGLFTEKIEIKNQFYVVKNHFFRFIAYIKCHFS